MHICIVTNINIGSDNGLSPGQHQAIIWTNAGTLLIRPFGTNFSKILIKIYTFSFKKMHLKMSSGKWRPSCLGLNVLTTGFHVTDNVHSFRQTGTNNIAVTSHDNQGTSIHHSLDCLFMNLFKLMITKEIIRTPHCYPLCWDQILVCSLHEGPVMQKVLSSWDVLMEATIDSLNKWWPCHQWIVKDLS